MHLAHGLGSGGPEIEFLIFAGALLLLGVGFFLQGGVKPVVSVGLVLASLALGAGAFAFQGGQPSGRNVTLTIESPAPDSVVPAGEPVDIEVTVSGYSGGHLHVYVDDQLESMVSAGEATVTLEPGDHVVAVELSARNHASLNPPVIDQVTVTAR